MLALANAATQSHASLSQPRIQYDEQIKILYSQVQDAPRLAKILDFQTSGRDFAT